MKLKYLSVLTFLFMLPFALKAGDIDKIAELLKQGNAHELAKMFSSSIDMNIADEANVYSKTQAEMILDRFFKDNKPRTIKLLHRVNSNPNYNFGVAILNTDKGKYRVSYTLREINKVMVIIELRIEGEKT